MKKTFNLLIAASFVVLAGLTNGCVTNESKHLTTRNYTDADGTYHEDETLKGHDITTDPGEMIHHLFSWLDFGFGRDEYEGRQYPQYRQQPTQVIIQQAPQQTQPRIIYVPQGAPAQVTPTPPSTPVIPDENPSSDCPETTPQSDEVVPDGPVDEDTSYTAPVSYAPQAEVVYVSPPPAAYSSYAPPNYYPGGNYYPAAEQYDSSSLSLGLGIQLGGGGGGRGRTVYVRQSTPSYYHTGGYYSGGGGSFHGGNYGGGFGGSHASASAGGFGAHASAGGHGR